VTKPTKRYGHADIICYALNVAEEIQNSEPKTWKEAIEGEDSQLWLLAMNEEMKSLRKNKAWILVDQPKKHKAVGYKWIFKKKEGIPGIKRPRFKARLVAKGFTQVEGIDYNEIFLLVVKHCSTRIMLGLVNQYDLKLEQLDVKTDFLHGNLKETIYMNHPEGFEEGENKVCLLKKSLYGLKQSPRMWYLKFDEFLIRYDFIRNRYDSCVYILKKKVCVLYLLLYVDDILIASANKEEIRQLKESLNTEFEMKDLGSARRILGIDIHRDRATSELFLSQSNYHKKVVEKFRMHQSKPISTPLGHHTKLSVT